MARTLTATDRCDRCGAQAYAVSAHHGGTKELLWCAHHLREHRGNLIPFLIHDETHKLAAEEPVPA